MLAGEVVEDEVLPCQSIVPGMGWVPEYQMPSLPTATGQVPGCWVPGMGWTINRVPTASTDFCSSWSLGTSPRRHDKVWGLMRYARNWGVNHHVARRTDARHCNLFLFAATMAH